MGISLVSVSHKAAPLEIRKLFAFSKEEQAHLMGEICDSNTALECVVISTCNRTELYTYQEDNSQKVCSKIQDYLLKEAGAQDIENIGTYIRFYWDEQAVRHLFEVTCGLDSMVMGEDQILGQVKEAHEQARKLHRTGVYLNTFFRYAVTGAKKVKTDTNLSKTSTSTATLAIKAAEEVLGTLEDKKVMIIGASGKIGGIVMKNLSCIKNTRIYVTQRNTALAGEHHKAHVESYDNRYTHLNEMDVVISATSSPHYTLTFDKVSKTLTTEKKRVFIDLAVPIDIEKKIEEIPGITRYDIDDFKMLSAENNKKKKKEANAAGEILEDYILDFRRWMAFQQTIPIQKEIKDWMIGIAEKKGMEKAIDKMFYRLRENSRPEELKTFMEELEGAK